MSTSWSCKVKLIGVIPVVVGLVVPMMLVARFVFPQTSSIQLSILQPENGDVVPRRQCGSRDLESCADEMQPLNVTGISSGLGANKIVLFVYSPPAERWFFQGEATVGSDGRWEVGDIIVSGGIGVRPGDSSFHFVATAMSELPPGLSDVPSGEFPPPGTLAQSPAVLVKRGN